VTALNRWRSEPKLPIQKGPRLTPGPFLYNIILSETEQRGLRSPLGAGSLFILDPATLHAPGTRNADALHLRACRFSGSLNGNVKLAVLGADRRYASLSRVPLSPPNIFMKGTGDNQRSD